MSTVWRYAVLILLLVGSLYTIKAMTTPCSHEDSPGPCYWDATERGNHMGHSFIRLDPRGR